jgi:Zn-dependent protease with chaperone function
MLAPSHLPAARQQQLRVAFDGLVQGMPPGLPRYAGYRPAYRLEFRSGMGANAFALPGGTIVMTDGIVRQAKVFGMPDDALLGVLAHEMGHVAQRHTSRAVLQQGVLQTGMSLALGDVSGIFASSATLLTGLAYSRAHEVEADCFAIALMRHLGKSTKPMGELLLALDNQADDEEAPAAAASAASGTAQSGRQRCHTRRGRARLGLDQHPSRHAGARGDAARRQVATLRLKQWIQYHPTTVGSSTETG